MTLRFRALHPADAARPAGSAVTVSADLDLASDPGAATGAFAAEQVLVLVLPDDAGSTLGAGTELVVVGERRMMHHLPSAVDIEITALAVRAGSVAAEVAEAEFSQAMMRVSLALAAGADGVRVPARYAGPLGG